MFVWSKLSSKKLLPSWEERFLSLGQTNAVITELAERNTLRIEVYCTDNKEAQKFIKEFGGRVKKLKTKDWANLTPKSKRPLIKIRDTLLITDKSDPREIKTLAANHKNRSVISIPAALAFGTGNHATTSTCLRILVDLAKSYKKNGQQWSFCDIGTGTGILAIAAQLLGATNVEGFDFDAIAVEVALHNLTQNNVGDVTIYEADLFTWTPTNQNPWDIIAANIFTNVLTENLPKIFSSLASGGNLILSGILREHEKEVINAAQNTLLFDPKIYRKGKWISLHYQKN